MHPRHVYVHVPFCARRCAYCDFSIAVRRHVPVTDFVRAIAGELTIRFPDDALWEVDTLYLGGGTPSRLGPDGVRRLLDVLRTRISLKAGAEVTLEANPEDVTDEAVAAWREAGIDRVSLGAQTFDDDVLRWMHRVHDAAAIRCAVETVRSGGIDNLSLDLIFALPAEVPRVWERDVTEALALDPDHLSLYGLTVEVGTPLGRWRERGTATEAPEERYESEFLHAHTLVTGAGFDHYEVSNFGKPGRWSRHNSSYWTGVSYLGLGPAAHGFDGAERRWNAEAYVDWLGRVNRGVDPVEGAELLDPSHRTAETIYLGLRTSAGLPLADAERPRVQPWLDAGWGDVTTDGRLVLGPTGWLRLDALAADLTNVRSHS